MNLTAVLADWETSDFLKKALQKYKIDEVTLLSILKRYALLKEEIKQLESQSIESFERKLDES